MVTKRMKSKELISSSMEVTLVSMVDIKEVSSEQENQSPGNSEDQR